MTARQRAIPAAMAIVAGILMLVALWPERVAVPAAAILPTTPVPDFPAPAAPEPAGVLFGEGGAEPPAEGAPVPAETSAPPVPVAPPAVTGIIVARGGLGLALVRKASGDTVEVRRGGEVEGWRLTVLTATTATFRNGARIERVALDRSNRRNRSDMSSPTPLPNDPERISR